jgi:hypothetical protein
MKRNPPPRPALVLACAFLLALPLAARGASQSSQPVAAAKGPSLADPVALQQELFRFGDEFSTRIYLGIDRLRVDGKPLARGEVLRWKISLGTNICSIATGPSAVADLLDMTVLVSVTRAAVEDYWQPKMFGESAQPLLDSCRGAEAEIWRIAASILNSKQQAELHQVIAQWTHDNPIAANIQAARALGFVGQVGTAEAGGKEMPGSIFGLLKLDPLAGMDPAVREIAQTRLLAERGLYVTQKMPQLLQWQMELLGVNATELPAVQQLVANTTQLTAAVDRVSHVAEQLPATVDKQREEIVKALGAQETQLTPLVASVNQTLGTGKDLSNSLNATIVSLDALMKRFGVGEPKPPAPPGPPPPPGEPFHIEDYTRSAAQLAATAKQLTELINALNQTADPANVARLSAQVTPVVQQAQTSGKELVNYAFWRAILFLVAVLAAALVYRFAAGRVAPRGKEKQT